MSRAKRRLLITAVGVLVVVGTGAGVSLQENKGPCQAPCTYPLGIRYVVEADKTDKSWLVIYQDENYVHEKQKAYLHCDRRPPRGKAVEVERRIFTDGSYQDLAICTPFAPSLVKRNEQEKK